jgi:Na+/H+ antiporter NhaD/arsenite permease-like protein
VDSSIFFITLLFLLGYSAIVFEGLLAINKTTTALALAFLMWTSIHASHGLSDEFALSALHTQFADICEFIFFVWGAMIIVEIINEHKGLEVVSYFLHGKSAKSQHWIMCFFAFFLSSVLDNLTTTIVMLSILGKKCENSDNRRLIGAACVLAANCGGAWTPIGDVTTTMLWIGGQISTIPLIKQLFLPSFCCAFASTLFLSRMITNEAVKVSAPPEKISAKSVLIGVLGVCSLVFVPIFKILTGFPPYVGMLLSMSVVGVISDVIDGPNKYGHLPFYRVMQRVESSTILFFMGILLSVGALEAAGVLGQLTQVVSVYIQKPAEISFLVGIVSALIDNVPLVKACMGMYSTALYPKNHELWMQLAYTAGVGGNLLIIGSASGIIFMDKEKVGFLWYFKRITPIAFASYILGFFLHQLSG